MSDDFQSLINYRMVRAAALRIVVTSRHAARTFDPEVPGDIGELRVRTIMALALHGRTVPDAIVNQAVDDAIHRRRPRW